MNGTERGSNSSRRACERRSYTYVLIWMGISIAVILFNKWLLAFSGFPFPIALTLWHMAFCSFVGFMAIRVLKVVKSHNMSPRDYYTRVMPIGKAPAPRALLGFLLRQPRGATLPLISVILCVCRPPLRWKPVALELCLPFPFSQLHPGKFPRGRHIQHRKAGYAARPFTRMGFRHSSSLLDMRGCKLRAGASIRRASRCF